MMRDASKATTRIISSETMECGNPDVSSFEEINTLDLFCVDGNLQENYSHQHIGDKECELGDSGTDDSDFKDSEYEISDDDELFDVNVDDGIECGLRRRKENESSCSVVDQNGEIYSDYELSDELESLEEFNGDDGDQNHRRIPEFRVETDMDNPQFSVGMVFGSKIQFRDAVKEYGIKNRVAIKFYKNDKRRMGAMCREGCDWKIYASKLNDNPNDPTFQVKTYKPKHSCARTYENKHLTYKWLAKHYLWKFDADPKCNLIAFGAEVYKDFTIHCPMMKLWRARSHALKLLEGTHEEQYSRVDSYAQEVRLTNPGSTLICKRNEGLFLRLYVCLDACKKGFLAGCRKIISFDGCHIKDKFGGQILTAIGIDANDCIYPIAYAVVEAETRETWGWFFQLLVEDLEIQNVYCLTLMSDKQKGIVPALGDIFLGAEQRFCVRHLYENFKGSHKGKGLKDILWSAARASYLQDHEFWMEEMRKKDVNAYKWLKEKPAHQWSRSHFSSTTKCDMLLNNCCECFNKMILDSREKPILSMVESIRGKLMNRIYSKRVAKQKFSGNICPKIQKKLEKNKELSSKCWPEPSSLKKFQVKHVADQFCVDMETHTCSCRRWQLSGIPCPHAVSAMFFNRENPEDYVDQCYSLVTYSRIYEFSINPINGHKMWPKSNATCLPPQIKSQPGRPKKTRKKSANEDGRNTQKMAKTGGKSTCSKCKQEGHNMRTCKFKKDVNAKQNCERAKKLPVRKGPNQVNFSHE